MKQMANGFVGKRVLKFNVGFLIAAGPGHIHDTAFDVPAVRIAEDADADYLRGPLRLSRTKEGILVQGQLAVGVEDRCYRCLAPVSRAMDIEVEELYTYPASPSSEFNIGDDAMLDLAPLVRAEMIIQDSERVLCRPDCKGLCPTCGADRNTETCACDDDPIDPRLAGLRALLDR